MVGKAGAMVRILSLKHSLNIEYWYLVIERLFTNPNPKIIALTL